MFPSRVGKCCFQRFKYLLDVIELKLDVALNLLVDPIYRKPKGNTRRSLLLGKNNSESIHVRINFLGDSVQPRDRGILKYQREFVTSTSPSATEPSIGSLMN